MKTGDHYRMKRYPLYILEYIIQSERERKE